MQTTVFIPGLHCDACATLIKEVSSDFPSIHKVTVDLDAKQVTLEHSDDFPQAGWIAAVEELGADYHVKTVS